MSDKKSASIFANIFKLLAENTDQRNKELALQIFKQMKCYDFHPCQMGAEAILEQLDLAREEKNPDYPEDEEEIIWVYGPKII